MTLAEINAQHRKQKEQLKAENEAIMRERERIGNLCGEKSKEIRTLTRAFKDCIEELEALGYCHDHPSLIKYRTALGDGKGGE